ncbi:MAG: hypothetical protein NC418_08485 [Muribaculaceae bacterium]|nr:hypothetical protein [Muribaculaceae bacterium]
MSILILIIVIFILWPLLKTGWRIWMQMRSMRRFMADPAGEMRRQAERRARQGGSRQSAPQPEVKKKKISRDVGEYVEFTEIELSAEEREASRPDGGGSRTIRTEEQISDIKWVDIK